MTFTPGPWAVMVEEEWNEYGGTSARYVTGVDSGSGVICEFADDYGTNRSANARLIAAAPDLLEACEEFIWTAQDAVHALNDLGHSCPASVGLAAEHAQQAVRTARGETR